MCDIMRHFKLQCVTTMRHFKYNVWQWDLWNTMCDNETFEIQCVTMRHLKYNVWQWDIWNTMCDKMEYLNYNVWHNGTF